MDGGKKFITETGLPTEEAIAKGWIKDYYENENLSFDEFLALYPVFETYDPDAFQLIDGFWEIPLRLKNELEAGLASHCYDYDQQTQIKEYLAE